MIRKTIIVVLTSLAVAAGLVSAIGIPENSTCEFRNTSRTWLVLGGSGSYVEFLYSHLSINPNYSVREQEMVFRAYREPKIAWLDFRLRDMWSPHWHFDFVAAQPAFQGGTEMLVNVGLRLWVLAVLLGLYPSVVFTSNVLRRWRRRRKGLCLKCGYDLTGNESGVCPECGIRVEQA